MGIFDEYDNRPIQLKNYMKRSTKIFNILHYQPSKYIVIPMIFITGLQKITYKKIKKKVIKKVLLHHDKY